MHIMVIPSWYSSPRNMVHGSFFKEQFHALVNRGEKITVAYNEIWPITMIGKIHEKRGINFVVEDKLRTYRYKDYNYLPKNPLMFKLFNKRMEKLYLEILKKEGKVDIIHVHSAFWAGISANYISKKYNIPLVLTEHSSLKYAKYVRESYKKYIYETYKNSDALITVSNDLKKEIDTYVNREIKVIHNMVDLKLFDLKENHMDNLENEFIFFSCAFLEEGKGMEDLITAFSKTFKDEKKVTLKIGGDGTLKEELEKLVKDLKMEEQIKLLGKLSRKEVANEMRKCNAFVLTSEHETFGVVYIEAMACGKPVIGTNNGGAEEIINKDNGIIAKKNDLNSISEALENMKKNYKNYSENKIRDNVISNYSEKVLAEKLKGVYKEVNERYVKKNI